MELGRKTKMWLKAVHILFAGAWLGSVMSTGILHLLLARPGARIDACAIISSMQFLDSYVIVPASIGCLVTGLGFSAFTSWGFTKCHWVAFKWVTTVLQIVAGIVFMRPWLDKMILLAQQQDLAALKSQYLRLYYLNTWLGSVQAALLVTIILISVLKPGGKSTKNLKP